jgi:hypothetical protein
MTTTKAPQRTQHSSAEHPDLLTIHEVASRLRWDATTVRRHIKSGVIPTTAVVPLPHHSTRTIYRIKRVWLDAVLAGKETHQEPDLPPSRAL